MTRSADLPKHYLPDFGISLVKQGLGTIQIVIEVFFVRFDVMPDGTITSSVAIGFPTEAHLATFDFKDEARNKLVDLLEKEFPSLINNMLHEGITLPRPITLTITARLGDAQVSWKNECFIPLIVTDIEESR